MKELPPCPFSYTSSYLSEVLNTGRVIVTGGSVKVKQHMVLGVHARISSDKKMITPFVFMEDLATTSPDGKRAKYLFFEVEEFGLGVVQDMPVPFRSVVQSDGGGIEEKASDLAGYLVHDLVWDCCKKIRFNLTSRIVTCSVKLNNSAHLSSISAFEWSEDEDVGYFFELR